MHQHACMTLKFQHKADYTKNWHVLTKISGGIFVDSFFDKSRYELLIKFAQDKMNLGGAAEVNKIR